MLKRGERSKAYAISILSKSPSPLLLPKGVAGFFFQICSKGKKPLNCKDAPTEWGQNPPVVPSTELPLEWMGAKQQLWDLLRRVRLYLWFICINALPGFPPPPFHHSSFTPQGVQYLLPAVQIGCCSSLYALPPRNWWAAVLWDNTFKRATPELGSIWYK